MPPSGRRRPTRLLWLAHATEGKGTIRLDAGAVRAVTERRASLLPAGITAVSGAFVAGDPVECEALRTVWGDAAPALRVSSTKAAHGHLLGAAGAMEAAWTILALQTSTLPPTRGVQAIDARCAGLDHVLGEGRRDATLRHAISNSFAFGGTNATLVFSRA